MKIINKIIESHYKPLIRKEKQSDFEYIYFVDCFDLIDILKGIKRFTEDNEQVSKSSDINTLAYNLILDNWIGEIYLLPPHQSEFFDLLNYDFGIKNPHITDNDLNKLINKNETINKFSELKKASEFREFIETTVDKSIDRFNLFGLWRENNWQKRLKLLIDSGVLKISEYNLTDYISLVKTENFSKIKKSIDELRTDYSIKSNFNDALALTYLLKIKSSGKIPILIDSKNFFKKIIKNANLEEEFKYNLNTSKNSKKIKTSIVRDSTYLVLKSIFDNPTLKRDAIKSKFPNYYKILENSNEEVTSIENILIENDLKSEFLKEYDFKDLYSNNKEEFGEYLEKEFFNTIWLSCYQQDNFNQFIENHFEYQNSDNINNINAINEYKKSFENTYQSVKSESNLFSILTQIWSELKRTKASDYISIGAENNAFQAMMLFGAFRFSLPFEESKQLEEIEEIISNILFYNGLLGNEIEQNNAINKTILYLFEGLKGNLNSYSIALTILWSLERFKWINKLFADNFINKNYPHYSFSIIHSASMLKETSLLYNREKVEKNLNCIETKIDSKNYKYLIGKSYLCYMLWDSDFNKNFSLTLNMPLNTSKYYHLALDAVSNAINYLIKLDYINNQSQLMLLVYGLNLKIYLVVEGGTNDELKSIEKEVNLFVDFETSNKGLWQGRYHDTISRYDLRLALIKYELNNIASFEYYLNQSEDRIKKALNNTFQEKQKAFNMENIIIQIKDKFKDNTLSDFLKQSPL